MAGSDEWESNIMKKDVFDRIKKLGRELSDLLLTSPELNAWNRIEITMNEIKIVSFSSRILLRAELEDEEK